MRYRIPPILPAFVEYESDTFVPLTGDGGLRGKSIATLELIK